MDRKFKDMKALEPTPTPLTRPPLSQWMLETTTWLIDEHTELHHNPQHNRNVALKVTKAAQRSLVVDYMR